MVNKELRGAFHALGLSRGAASPGHFLLNFAMMAALTPSTHGCLKCQEVVLVQAIHELLRYSGRQLRLAVRVESEFQAQVSFADAGAAFDNARLDESGSCRGQSMPALTFFFAFAAVLALIGVAAWLVRRFANNRLGANTNRGRMPRLAVIDAAAVDGRRRLVLVRRDNVEHLLMIGGPTDIVVEPNIVRAQARADQMPQRPPGGAEPPRIAPLPDAAAWSDGDHARADGFDHHPEPQHMPEPPPRPMRPAFADEVRRPPVLAERRAERAERNDPLAGFSPEPMGLRPEPRAESRAELRPELRGEPRPEPRAEPRPEPMPPPPPRMPRGEPLMPRPVRPAAEPKAPPMRAERPAPPPPPPAPTPAQAADQNLAEMAQRLEAALRRPAGNAADAPPVAPEPPPPPPPPVRAVREVPAPPAPSSKTSFENLEEEMASLLGRPKSQSS
jgi:flagellar protein FliO/FliZ